MNRVTPDRLAEIEKYLAAITAKSPSLVGASLAITLASEIRAAWRERDAAELVVAAARAMFGPTRPGDGRDERIERLDDALTSYAEERLMASRSSGRSRCE